MERRQRARAEPARGDCRGSRCARQGARRDGRDAQRRSAHRREGARETAAGFARAASRRGEAMKPSLIVIACCALAACATGPQDQDPLRNTKKLAAEGHATLYRNGAFQVPRTTVHLIPPGPGAVELAAELAGMRALQSFQESVKHARESADLAKAGVERSVNAAVAINRGADSVAREAQGITRLGTGMMSAAPGVGSSIVAISVSHAGPVYSATRDAGEKTVESTAKAGQAVSGATDRATSAVMSGTVA